MIKFYQKKPQIESELLLFQGQLQISQNPHEMVPKIK